MPSRLAVIATLVANLWREAWRERLFQGCTLLVALLLAVATLLRQLDFGADELSFLADFGYGTVYLFGSLLAIWMPAHHWHQLRETGQLALWQVRPVGRASLVGGLLIGHLTIFLLWALLIIGVMTALIVWRTQELQTAGLLALPWQAGDYLLGGVLQGLRLALIAALSLLFALFFRRVALAWVITTLVVLICQLQFIALELWSGPEHGLLRWPAGLLAIVFPNFQLFELPTNRLLGEGFPLLDLASTGGYALLYLGAYGFLALLLYARHQREEIAA